MTYKQIPVIIPSLEPDERLPELLQKLKQADIENIILVNDGSSALYDAYFEQAEQLGCIVLRHAVNQGKGRALKTAFNYCLLRWPNGIGCVTADSDGQHTPECILNCMKALFESPESLILGCRDFDAPGVPAKSKNGNKLTCLMFRLFVGLKVSDTQTGLRGISTQYMKKLLSTPGERFEFESNMLIDTKDAGVNIKEIPIQTIYDSKENHTTHFNPIKDSIRIYAIFGKFLFSSLSSSVVDLVLFALFCKLFAGGILGIGYIMAATFLARIVSAIYNYTINYKLVFKSKEKVSSSSFKYFLVAACKLALSAALVTLLHRFIPVAEVLCKILADTLLFFVSYRLQQEFVYYKKN